MPEPRDPNACPEYNSLTARPIAVSRRSVLATAGFGLIGWLAAPKTALAQVSVNPDAREGGDILVVVFLEGGMDGLHAVVPYADENYHRHRPSLRMNEPGKRGSTLDLDGFFGFHPALAPLHELYQSKSLAIIHAVGSGDKTRSHFEARGVMERGAFGGGVGANAGWIARYLEASALDSDSPMRAVSLSTTLPDSLLGSPGSIVLPDLNAYRLQLPEQDRDRVAGHLARMYGGQSDAISKAGRDTLAVLKKLDKLDPKSYQPQGSAYPESPFGEGMKQAAMLIKAEVGLEVACLNAGGWDTHVAQGGTAGNMANLLADLAQAMAAFHSDLGPRKRRVTVVAMTEFGRRVYENTGLGTDHGRAGVMFIMGDGLKGGRVYGEWPGLAPDQLEEPGDLRVTTDYRAPLAELIACRSRLKSAEGVFEGYRAKPVGIFG